MSVLFCFLSCIRKILKTLFLPTQLNYYGLLQISLKKTHLSRGKKKIKKNLITCHPGGLLSFKGHTLKKESRKKTNSFEGYCHTFHTAK